MKNIVDPYSRLGSKKIDIEERSEKKKNSFLGGIFGSRDDEFATAKKSPEPVKEDLFIDDSPISHVSDLQGVYLYGGPGSGKTFMMDLFYSQVAISNKRRAAYTSFVLQIHKMNHINYRHKILDPLFKTSLDVAKQYRLFCFDEVQVTEVGDAILMKRFFDIMWKLRVVLVVSTYIKPRQLQIVNPRTCTRAASKESTFCLSLIW